MAKTFLQIIPLELRKEIYRHVFQSPSGLISLARTSFQQKPTRYKILTLSDSVSDFASGCSEHIDLSFLRTCRQIYEEAKDVFWECNTLDLALLMSTHSQSEDSLNGLHQGIASNVRKVQLDLDVINRDEQYWTGTTWSTPSEDCLREIGKWPKMKCITLMLRNKWNEVHPGGWTFDDLESILEDFGDLDPSLRILTADNLDLSLRTLMAVLLTGKIEYVEHLERRMIVDFGTPTFDQETGQPTRFIKGDGEDVHKLFKVLSGCFGASLSVNGKLHYIDGKFLRRAGRPFITSELDGEATTFLYWDWFMWDSGK